MICKRIKMILPIILITFIGNSQTIATPLKYNNMKQTLINEKPIIEVEVEVEDKEESFVSIFAEAMLEEYEIVEEIYNEPDYVTINVVVSYYTKLEEENGEGYAGRNAIDGYLSNTSVAIPRNGIIEYGMKLEFEDLGVLYMADYDGQYLERIADDCGNPSHIRVREDGVYRIDIFCPELEGEIEEEYKARVNRYGKHETTCKVYLE